MHEERIMVARGDKTEFTDNPLPPWELPGAIRRDCEPDRNWLLGPLGDISLVCGVASFFPCTFPVAIVAVPLGLTTWLLARLELARMRAGAVDRRGELRTREAAWEGCFGLLCCLTFGLLWGSLLLRGWVK